MEYPKDYINKIICGDCLEVMKDIPDKSIDLTVTSPPYDNLRDYGNDWTFDFEGIARELFRITKEDGVVVWVVGDATINGSESGTSFRQALGFIDIGFKLHDTMIYQRIKNPPLTHNRYEQEFEYMFVFSKGSLKTFNPIMIKTAEPGRKKNLNDGPERVAKYEKKKAHRRREGFLIIKENKIKGNVWFYNTGYNHSTRDIVAFEHPAIFPDKLASDHIKSWSNENDIVLDPFFGSGTTVKMARKLNRNFIGIEINPDYCKIAEQRLLQTELFTPETVKRLNTNQMGINI